MKTPKQNVNFKNLENSWKQYSGRLFLLNCIECHTIVTLKEGKVQRCGCKQSFGWVKNGQARYSGPGRVLSFLNQDYAISLMMVNPANKIDMIWRVMPEDGMYCKKIFSDQIELEDESSDI